MKRMMLSVRLIVGVAILSVVGLVLLYGVTSITVRNVVHTNTVDILRYEKMLYASEIDAWFHPLRYALETLAVVLPAFTLEESLEIMRTIAPEHPSAGEMFLAFGDNGELISATHPDDVIPDDFDSRTRSWYILARDNPGQVTVSDLYMNSYTGVPTVTMSLWLPELFGRPGAAINSDISLDALSRLVGGFDIYGGGYMVLASHGGSIIYHPLVEMQPPRFDADGSVIPIPLPTLADMPGGDFFLENLQHTEEYLSFDDDALGGSLLMSFPVGQMNFALAAVVPQAFVSGVVSDAVNVVIIAFGAVLVALLAGTLVYVSLQVRRAVAGYVQDFKSASGALAAGSYRADNNWRDTSFGLHRIRAEFDANLDILSRLIGDITQMADEHSAGNYRYAISPDAYKDAQRKVVDNINKMAVHHTDAKEEILECITKIVRGDFDAAIREFPGDESYINQSVEGLRANIKAVAETVFVAASRARAGDMQFSIDESRFSGAWSRITRELNSIFTAIGTPLAEIADVLGAIQAGRLDTRVCGQYEGEFLIIGRALNETCTSLQDYIDEINTAVARLRSGDLGFEITREFLGAFASIKESINRISHKYSDTLGDIGVSVAQLKLGISEISASSAHIAQGAQSQAATLQELSATLGIFDTRVKEGAQRARDAAAMATTSRDAALGGNVQMQKLLEAISHISESGKKISAIVGTIDGISFQTNLLALNASVEAARAGEHGRGFSVVAEEVRNLAGRSSVASKEIGELIRESISRVADGASLADNAAQSLTSIVESAAGVADVISGIYESAADQTLAISEITRGLEQISEVAGSSSVTSQQAAASSGELDARGDALKEQLGVFSIR